MKNDPNDSMKCVCVSSHIQVAHTGSHCTFLLTFVFFATYCDFKDESEKSWHSGKEMEVIFLSVVWLLQQIPPLC